MIVKVRESRETGLWEIWENSGNLEMVCQEGLGGQQEDYGYEKQGHKLCLLDRTI